MEVQPGGTTNVRVPVLEKDALDESTVCARGADALVR
jgi:hypothetical protein